LGNDTEGRGGKRREEEGRGGLLMKLKYNGRGIDL
jgi:hypothetical protein